MEQATNGLRQKGAMMAMKLSLTTKPHDCVLAIVGSRDVPNYSSESLITEAILSHAPRMVVSGGAWGVDRNVTSIASNLGIPVMEFVPELDTWDAPASGEAESEVLDNIVRVHVPGGYKQRNENIAEACTCLVRIYSSTSQTYGSGWTADYAEKLGKRVTRHLVG